MRTKSPQGAWLPNEDQFPRLPTQWELALSKHVLKNPPSQGPSAHEPRLSLTFVFLHFTRIINSHPLVQIPDKKWEKMEIFSFIFNSFLPNFFPSVTNYLKTFVEPSHYQYLPFFFVIA